MEGLQALHLLLHPIGGAQEILHTEGLEQIVDGIDAEALDGILGVGRGEDNERRHGERLNKIHAVEVGHVDVAEDGVDDLLVEDVAGLKGTLTLCHEFQERHFLDIGGELLQGQGLVVDG